MSRIVPFVVLFLVAFYVHPSWGQEDLSLELGDPNSFPKLIQSIGSRVAFAQDLRNSSIYEEILSIVSEIKELLSLEDVRKISEFFKEVESDRCKEDIEYLYKTIQNKDMWGIKMLDAFGKLQSGFFDGNFKWVGNFHECTSIHVPLNENGTGGGFDGQYSTFDISTYISDKHFTLTFGVCLPSSCEKDLATVIGAVKDPLSSFANITKLFTHPVSRDLTPAAVGVITLLSFVVLLVVIGSSMTAYEYFSKSPKNAPYKRFGDLNGDVETQGNCSDVTAQPDENTTSLYETVKPFFDCFCAFTNGEKLLNTENAEGQLPCLHGIRFLSMSWVIVCHTYAFCFVAVGNFLETMSLINTIFFQIILNGFYSVDSFFVLSGFLVAYLFFQEASKSNGKFPWVYFYVHRYIRLTPVYMLALAFYTTLFYYLGNGPFWLSSPVDPVCHKNWWYNLLYINNFAAPDKQCFNWSWYLANDMQFFVISPLFLVTLYKWPVIGYSVLGVFLSASFFANFGITYYYDLFSGLGNISNSNLDMETFTTKFSDFFEKLYIKPYNRISPYLVGIALAYYLHRRKQSNRGKENWIILSVGWIISSVVTLTCLFILYDNTFTTFENSLYNALNRTLFAGGLCWVLFTCLTGQGGPVNAILSFKLFIPLSRLTYSAYLIHPIILFVYFNSLKAPLQFSQLTLVTTFLGVLVMTYAFAFLVSVLFESPVIRLDKLVRTKFRS